MTAPSPHDVDEGRLAAGTSDVAPGDESVTGASEPVTLSAGATGEPVVLRVVARTLSILAGLGIVLMMILTVIDVARRKAGMGSIPGALEFTEVALVAVVFASMMSAESSGAHVRTALLTSRLPPRAAAIARLIGILVVIVFLVWTTYWTWDAAMESMRKGERRFGGNEVPMWPSKLFIPIGFGGMALEYVAHAVGAVRALRTGQITSDREVSDPGSLL